MSLFFPLLKTLRIEANEDFFAKAAVMVVPVVVEFGIEDWGVCPNGVVFPALF